MAKPHISIVIVNYNVKDFLYKCLKSIEAASDALDVEVIVVDNNSSDASMAALPAVFPTVGFIPLMENIGFGKANNIGIQKAEGKYLLILNPDTILEQNTLKAMYDFMEVHPDAGIAGCKVLNADGSFQLACRRGFPTPWASFTKLFGLQKLFPKSKLFSKYNLTYLDENDTYEVDAVIGAFMFCRTELVKDCGGFDPAFFMYGEDLDLCYEVKNKGYKVYYTNVTSIIHFKGESTKRSSINEVKRFYEAMKIFARKHYGSSALFLSLLKAGITARSILAYLNKYKTDFFFITIDIIAGIAAILIGSRLRFGSFLGLPDYAYPTVFIAVGLVIFISMFSVGEYFEDTPRIRKAFMGSMLAFFLLSTLTYFFKNYAFSRAIALFIIGFSCAVSITSRAIYILLKKTAGEEADRNVAIAGSYDEALEIARSIESQVSSNLFFKGLISTGKEALTEQGIPVLGHIDYLNSIIKDYRIQDIIVTDKKITQSQIIRLMQSTSGTGVRFHIANEYEEFIASNIINDISGAPDMPRYNISLPRNLVVKRITDFFFSFIFITLGFPFIFIFSKKPKTLFSKLWHTLKGKMSIVGLHHNGAAIKQSFGKPGIISLANLTRTDQIPSNSADKLDDYYLRNYSFSLDIEVILKHLTRKTRGKNNS